MVFKIVFQVPFDEDRWDPEVAADLGLRTPGDPHGPHIKIYTGRRDPETGAPCALIRCKHVSLAEVERFAQRVRDRLPRLLGME